MKTIYMLFQIVVWLCLCTGVGADVKPIFGWVEKARISPSDMVLSAKLDTGADHSSLNVTDLTIFQRDGDDWVRFRVAGDNGESALIERKVIRIAKIKRHAGPRQERPVVKLGVCVGNYFGETEVNLVDRSRFKYQLLIGRSFMKSGLLVDPSLQYTSEPQCAEVGRAIE